ncbi:MAG TPA: hypothetical protein VLS90_16485, partial [Thermodesulfobacteriota bacterium]|nr:hypothetical protein [Thermodesulfobacteriota bacterium]
MKRKLFFASFSLIPVLVLYCCAWAGSVSVSGSTAPGEEALFTSSVKPNVLIILDNSNSMDEDFYGNAAGSWAVGSKSFQGKKVLGEVVNAYGSAMRLGLMTYRLPGDVSAQNLYNVTYFSSYDPKSYCPAPPAACVEYCRTGNTASGAACETSCKAQNSAFEAAYIDDSITGFAMTSEPRIRYCALAYPKTQRIINPADPGNYIYYKQALPYYSPSDEGNSFWVSPSYVADDSADSYYRYSTKTGTSDGMPNPNDSSAPDFGYSGFLDGMSVAPTDSDIALGYREFGRRQGVFYVGKTWFSNLSPGRGFLQVPIGESQQDALLNKLKVCGSTDAAACLTQSDDQRQNFYMSCNSGDVNACSYVVNSGLTPTAGTLQSAMDYFQGNYPGARSPIDPACAACQTNYIVYVTDGLPSVDESGARGSADALLDKVAEKLTTLQNLPVNVGAGSYSYKIRTYIVGVGLTEEAKAKLDRMAEAGGTAVNGGAYYADNPGELKDALDQVFVDIQSSNYSFSLPSISTVRFRDENAMYVASFYPSNSTALWEGHLQKYEIDSTGGIAGEVWDAGKVLETPGKESLRNIRTMINGAMRDFNTANIDKSLLGFPNSMKAEDQDEARNRIIGYIRGERRLPYKGAWINNPDYPRKFGDVFHSNPVTISSPSLFFNDNRDRNSAFASFRADNQRSSAAGTRIVIAGANDGQLHAFETGSGEERWSFIPTPLLSKLSSLDPTSSSKKHTYLVDGPISASEVWTPAALSDGTRKYEGDWRTLAVVSLGAGARTDTLWSKSNFCDKDFKKGNPKYSNGFDHYCGYYALDVTETSQFPEFKWVVHPRSKADADYMGEPWSKMAIGRVLIEGNERWVGFFGGGYFMGGTAADTPGKGFFVVDLRDGNILYSRTAQQEPQMDLIPGAPAVVDQDNDGFIDTAYVGDVSGHIWKFSFCPFTTNAAARASCKADDANWKAMRLYSSSAKLPVFSTPAVAWDGRDFWIFWGTGDKANPNAAATGNHFFALRDRKNPRSATVPAPYTDANLQPIPAGGTF